MTDTWDLMTESRITAGRGESRSGFLVGGLERRDGFTLLEVMVAVVVIAIVMTAVFRLQGQTISMAESTRFYTTAILLAQQKMAEMSGADPGDASDGSGDFGDDFPGFSWRVSLERVDSKALGETGRDLMRVDVAILFAEDAREFRLRTYLMKR